MYLNNLMTDDELIRAAQYAESHHLRLLAERLNNRRDDIKQAHGTARSARQHAEEGEIADAASRIADTEDMLKTALDK